NYNNYKGKTAIVPIGESEVITVKVHDKSKSNVFRIACHDTFPNFADKNDDAVYADTPIYGSTTGDTTSELSFVTGPNSKYLVVYVSNNGNEPRMQVEEGGEPSEYENGAYIPINYLDPELTSKINETNSKFNFPVNLNLLYRKENELTDYFTSPA